MPLTILDALRGLKQDPTRLIDRDAILRACREVGHKWRFSILWPVNLIHLFLTQILHGNTAIGHLPRLSGLQFTDSAYCQARARLPVKLFRLLLRRVADRLIPAGEDAERWHGHRLFHVDGSGASMPDTDALRAHYGQPANQKPGWRIPGRSSVDLIPCRHRDDPRSLDRPALHARHGGRGAIASPTPTRRPADRRPRVLLVRPPGVVAGAGDSRDFPAPSASDRRLHAGASARGFRGPRGASRACRDRVGYAR